MSLFQKKSCRHTAGGCDADTDAADVRSAVATLTPPLESEIASNEDRMTILLVDDDPDCRMMLRDAVTECRADCNVIEMCDGMQALSYIMRQGKYATAAVPSLIYLDLEMPNLNGLDTLRQIRQMPELKHVPVVMMTGVCGEAEMNLAAELGANSYTSKPANAEEFLKTVLASTHYWLKVHQYPQHHMPQQACRR